MFNLDVSYDTQEFEVPAELDEKCRLTRGCARRICEVLEEGAP